MMFPVDAGVHQSFDYFLQPYVLAVMAQDEGKVVRRFL
jgi:hypothetical protein